MAVNRDMATKKKNHGIPHQLGDVKHNNIKITIVVKNIWLQSRSTNCMKSN